MSKIGDKMKEVLQASKISQYKAAEMLGVSQPRLNQWLNNGREPGQQDIVAFCNVFKVTPNFLYGFESNTVSDEDLALLNAVKSVAARASDAKETPDTSIQATIHKKENESGR